MLKRTVIVLSMMIAFLVAVEPLQTAHGILLSKAEWIKINASDAAAADSGEKPESQDNGLLRALKAPFKAIGHLFGRGKKDSNKLQRTSEKDAKKFESAPLGRVNNATLVTQASPNENSSGSAEMSRVDHLAKGRALLTAGNLNEAIAELSLAVSVDPKSGEAQTLLGMAYYRKGLPDHARQAFETALHAPGDEAMHLNNLGYLLFKQGDYEEAIKYLKRAAKISSNDRRIWNNLGLAQSELGKFDDAYKSFAHALGEFDGRLNVASRLEAKGLNKEAIKHLEKARALRPNSTEVLERLVALYKSVGQPDAASLANDSLSAARHVAVIAK